MFKNLTYRQKFYAIIGGGIILFLASYKKTYKHTLVAKKELSLVKEKLSNNESSLNELYYLKNEIASLEKAIGGQTKKPEHVQQELLDFISKNEFNVNIVSIEDVHLFSDNDFLIYSNQVELEGDYKSLIETLHKIETKFKNSRVVSTEMYSINNYRTKTKTLYLKIILQNYEKAK